MNIKSIQTISKASYNLCSMVLATAAASAVSIFGTVSQAQANNSSSTDTSEPVRVISIKFVDIEPVTIFPIILNPIPVNPVIPIIPVTPETPLEIPGGSTGQSGNHVDTPEPSLILGFIAVGGLMLGSAGKAKN
ncbi:hypothetical protein [Dapis sp. BLCC M229]|uniref:hypothetical protein n=1 Tax=Dapis sp. BLCC M229 TaxID=3400188 RepID=UPI003CF39CF4